MIQHRIFRSVPVPVFLTAALLLSTARHVSAQPPADIQKLIEARQKSAKDPAQTLSQTSAQTSSQPQALVPAVTAQEPARPAGTRVSAYGPGLLRITPPRASGIAGEGPAGSYVIRLGDCLWDLSGSFLSDPFKWPQIWTLNPYIVNPDLIYPGNQLAMPGAEKYGVTTTAGDDAGDWGEPAGTAADTAGLPAAAQDEAENEWSRIRRIIHEKVLTAEYREQVPFLWFKNDEKGLVFPGDARIDPGSQLQNFRQFDVVPVKPFGSTVYRAGDTVDVFTSIRMVVFNRRKANLVRKIAKGVVLEVKGPEVFVRLYKVWDVVAAGNRVAKQSTDRPVTLGAFTETSQKIDGTVFQRTEENLFPFLFGTFILDRGSAQGVRMGDVFLTYPVRKGRPPDEPAQFACAVRVDDQCATLAIVKLMDKELNSGDRVSLVRRAVQ